MKNFSGEFGSITKRITFVGRKNEQSGMAEVSLMFTRMFGSYLPMKWLPIWDFSSALEVKKALDRDEIVVFAEMPWHNVALQKVLLNSKRGTLVGILLWDSDLIPENFVQILRTFNKIITPTSFIEKTIKKFIPEMNVVTLPLALDTRRFALSSGMRSNRARRKVQRFGVIASQHPRKNLDLLLAAATELWVDGYEFHLTISGFLKQGARFHQIIESVDDEIKLKYLHFSEERHSENEYVSLIESFDLLISASSGEGFNIPARQALSNGLPVLITDIPGHAELRDLPGVTLIPTRGKLPAIYPEFGNEIFGSQYLISKNDIKNGLVACLTTPAIDSRIISDSSAQWDFRTLEHKYRNELFENLNRPNQLKNKSKNLVVVGHDAGFFALFNTFVSIQNSWTGEHGFTNIYPDWRVSSIQKFWKTKEFNSFCYGQPRDGNIYFKLFDTAGQFDKSITEIDSILDRSLKGHSFNASADPNLTFVNADKLYRSMGFDAWRKSMNCRLSGLGPNMKVSSRLKETFKNLPEDAFLIGMHVRHPSHAMEQPDKKIALASDYIRIAQELALKEQAQNPGRPIRIFLATDQESVISEFLTSFGNALITISGTARVSKSQTHQYSTLHDSQKLKEGFQIQHLIAKNSNSWSMELAEDVIADAWGLARCDVLVHTVSNVATAVLFINPKIKSIPIYPDMNLKSIEQLQLLRSKTQII